MGDDLDVVVAAGAGQGMRDDGGPAFPGSDLTENNTIKVWQQGMTMRQWYKGQAPAQAPGWFKHRSRPMLERPEMQINGYISCEGVINPEVQRRVDNWRGDSCYDLSEPDPTDNWTEAELAAMTAYEIAWKDYWKAQEAWRIRDLEDRYFQWRSYYADAMIAEDEEFAKKAEGE